MDHAAKPLDMLRQAAPGQGDGSLLAEIAAGLSNGHDLRALLRRFLAPIVHLAGAQAGAVRVLTDQGDRLELVCEVGLPPDLCGPDRGVDRHCGHCGASADRGEVVWARDLGVCAARARSDFFALDARRLLVVPLQHRGRVLGVYKLFYAGDDAPRPEILALLKSIGELLGLALNNARLEQAQLRASLISERQMMAAEVHDSLAQSLAFVKMRMPLLQDALRAHDEAAALRYADDVRSTVSQAHASLRGILTHFRSPMDPHGLVHALAAHAEVFRQTSGTDLEFTNQVRGLQLPPEHEAQVFHIVQEALANVARHAAARHARLSIAPVSPGEVEIVVEDDGAGLPTCTPEGDHYGVPIMRERAQRLGGVLELGAREGGGTRLRLVFPAQGQEAGR
jgi:two-component system nitrate/nitrite sensor histidine kinase NarX